MAQTNVNIKMDKETKNAFDKICEENGISISSAFNIFAKTVVREQRIPFELTAEVPNSVTLAAMDAAEKRSDAFGPFDSVDAVNHSVIESPSMRKDSC